MTNRPTHAINRAMRLEGIQDDFETVRRQVRRALMDRGIPAATATRLSRQLPLDRYKRFRDAYEKHYPQTQ